MYFREEYHVLHRVPHDPDPASGVSTEPEPPTPDAIVTHQRRRFRRPSRDSELSDKVVQRAIPEGYRRATHTDEVLAALEAHPGLDQIRADRRRGLRRCLEALMSAADFSSMTTRPTWQKLSATLGVARRTVARYLQQLKGMGLLGVVASGRSAQYAVAGADGKRLNEAAVYVFCVGERRPPKLQRIARLLGLRPRPVEESVTPPSSAGLRLRDQKIIPRTRTRGSGSTSEEQRRMNCTVDQVRWNKHWAPSGTAQERTAAWRLKALLPGVLSEMSDRDVAASVREFFRAGWSVADVHHALDFKPDGTCWPHSGSPDTKAPRRIRGWLKYRLSAWRDVAGRPLESKDQHTRRRQDEAHACREADRAEQVRRKREIQQQSSTEGRRRGLAKLRSLLGAQRGAERQVTE